MLEVKLTPVHEVAAKAEQFVLADHPFNNKFPGRTVNIPGNLTGNENDHLVATKE